jgi:hypothetical protein
MTGKSTPPTKKYDPKDLTVFLWFPPLLLWALVEAPLCWRSLRGKSGKPSNERTVDYMNKEFQDVVLSKDGSAHGFVYFMPSSNPLDYKR